MQVVILAAGQSSRFEPFNNTFAHKSLVKIMGKTLLEHTLISIKKSGITNVLLVITDKDPFLKILGNESSLGLNIQYVVQEKPLGMGEALLAASEFLEDEFFVTSGYHLDFFQFAKKLKQKKKNNIDVVLLGKTGNKNQYGYMQVDKEKVLSVKEKPQVIDNSSLRIIGIYLLNKDFLKTLKSTPLSHYHFETALDIYAKQNHVKYFSTDTTAITLKYAWDLFDIKNYLFRDIKRSISKKAKIAKNVEIINDVVIEDGVEICEGVVIKGPVFIGKNSFIGTNSLLRNGVVIDENCLIGSFIEVKNVILMGNSTTHTGLIEDSIIGRNCKIAAGVITANVRLDRKNINSFVKTEKVDTTRTELGMVLGDKVSFGVNVTTMPGVIIGENCIIGPSTTVMKNIPSNIKYYTKFSDTKQEKNNQ